MIRTMRSSARQGAVALALAGLVASGPAQGFSPDGSDRISALAETVAALEEPMIETAHAAQEPAERFEVVGTGEASYYGHELAGNRTASGERFNPNALTAAHRSLPLGTKLRVTNKSNGRSVIVRINDRGPFVGRRVIDVSLAAAHKINMVRAGRAQVTLEIVRRT
jgi:rare lipoprotein A